MNINISKDCSCICPNQLKYNCDANGVCYQDDSGPFTSAQECIYTSKYGGCGKYIRLSSTFISSEFENGSLIGELSVTNTPANTNIVYTLDLNDIFIDNQYFYIENNKLYLMSMPPQAKLQKDYHIFIRAFIGLTDSNEDGQIDVLDAANVYSLGSFDFIEDMFTLSIQSDPTFYSTSLSKGTNISVSALGLSITFDSIDQIGYLTINKYENNELIVYDIYTSAIYTGNIQINYNNINNTINSVDKIDDAGNIENISVTYNNNILEIQTSSIGSLVLQKQSDISLKDISTKMTSLILSLNSYPNFQTIFDSNGAFVDYDTTGYIQPVYLCVGNQQPIIDIYNPMTLNQPCACLDSALDISTIINGAKPFIKTYYDNKIIIQTYETTVLSLESNKVDMLNTIDFKSATEVTLGNLYLEIVSLSKRKEVLLNIINSGNSDPSILDTLQTITDDIFDKQTLYNTTKVLVNDIIASYNNLIPLIQNNTILKNQYYLDLSFNINLSINEYIVYNNLTNFITLKECENNYLLDPISCTCILD